MKELTKKNGFDPSQFQDIKMNMLVSTLIAIGYVADYSLTVIVTVLYVEKIIDIDQEFLYISINQISLTVCIFSAYLILMKVFIGYQNQVTETAEKIEI